MKVSLVWWMGVGLAVGLTAAPVFEAVEPRRGPAGTVVTVTGSGFEAGLAVTVGGVAATVQQVTDTTLTLQLGATTGTGELRWSLDEVIDQPTGLGFEVIRTVAGQFNPPPTVTRAGYRVGWSPAVPELGAAPAFTAEVPVDRPALVWGARDETDPAFLVLVLPGDEDVVLDATSTAVALLTWVGPLSSRDPQQLGTVRAVLLAQAETAALATAWAQGAADGLDPMDDPRVETAFVAALQAAVDELAEVPDQRPVTAARARAPPAKTGAAVDAEVFVLTPGGEGGTAATPARLKFTVVAPASGRGPGTLKVESAGERNALDWMVELVPLQPSAYPEGRQTLLALDATTAPPGRTRRAMGTGYVRAKLIGQKFDLVELAANALVDAATGAAGITAGREAGDFPLPLDVPGLYAVQAYSGNIYHSNPALSGSASQLSMLEALDFDRRALSTTGANLVIAAVDAVAVAIDLSDLVPPSLILKTTAQIAVDVEKALQAYGAAGNDLGGTFAVDLFKTTVAAVGKVFIAEGLKGGAEVVAVKFSKTLGKNFVRVLDWSGRVSAGAQSAERLYALLSDDAFALERAVVMVGDPFTPRITSFFPLSGRTGTTIQIHGTNFPTSVSEVRVAFCNFGTGTPPPVTGELDLEVLSVTENSILARVPEGWEAEFGNERFAYLCVERLDFPARVFSTVGLPEPFLRFRYTGLPELFSIGPNPVAAGGVAFLQGRDFDIENRARTEILFNGEHVFDALPVSPSAEQFGFTVPSSVPAGSYQVSLRVEGVVTNAVPLTVVTEASLGAGREGLQIVITKADFSNVPDGEISILEAFLISTGTLGRPIEIHPPSDFDPGPSQPREIDHVTGANEFGFGGGAAFDDYVVVASALWFDEHLAVSAAQGLPPPGTGDRYELRGLIFDGGGAAGPGWDLNGVGGFWARVHLRNYGGHGVHLRGGTQRARLEATIESVGGHGVFFDGHATEAQFLSLQVKGAGGDAVRLSGPDVKYNALRLPAISTFDVLGLLEGAAGYGLVIEDGATHNHVHPGTVRRNTLGGVLLTGEDTQFNVVGRNTGVVPRYSDVVKNGGHGVLMTDGASHNLLRYLLAAGHPGDGYRIEGAGTSFNEIASCGTGLDLYPEGTVDPSRALRNGGAGVRVTGGAADNRIGGRQPGSYGWRGGLGNNELSGVIVEGVGTDRTIISRLNVGDGRALGGTSIVANPNGENGIHVRDGAKGTVIGDTHSYLDVHILGAPDGAAILVEGEGTDGTLIIGNQIGSEHGNNFLRVGEEIREGIVVRDGPQGTRIGLPGQLQFDQRFEPYRSFNVIGNATEHGIRLENVAGATDSFGQFQPAVVLMNNRIGIGDSLEDAGNKVGLLLGTGALGNQIGGDHPGEANRFENNTHTGIEIAAPALLAPEDRNRLLVNRIARTGVTSKAPGATDPAFGPTPGVGLLVSGGGSQVIGEGWNWPLEFTDNRVGIYLDQANDVLVRGASFRSSRLVAVAALGGGGHVIGDSVGGGLEIATGTAEAGPTKAGILLVQATGNRIEGNLIGVQRDGANGANQAPGIVLIDAPNNLIGGPTAAHGNVIGNSQGAGLVIRGSGSTGNVVARNWLGVDPAGSERPNNGPGIRLEQGASGNQIGGLVSTHRPGATWPLLGANTVEANTGAGVEVDGAGTVSNRILDNVITGNSGSGIALLAGGNRAQAHPTAATVDENRVSGTILDLLAIPIGSRLQIFTDPDPSDPEGAAFVGETTVGAGGAWAVEALHPLVYPNFSMTATHATTGDTSAFGFGVEWLLALQVARTDGGAPVERTISLGSQPTPVQALTLTATGAEVQVTELRLRGEGTLHEVADLAEVRLYRDRDRDGEISAGDELLADGGTYDADDGEVVWALEGVAVAAGLPVHWLVAYLAETASAPASGTTFAVQLENAQALSAQVGLPGGTVPVLGTFPVRSDNFTLGEAAGLVAAWLAEHFTPTELLDAEISGLGADPDGDGLTNLLEYLLARHPRQRDGHDVLEVFVSDGRWHFAFDRRAPPREGLAEATFSRDLAAWNAAGEVVESLTVTPLGNERERVVLRTLLTPESSAEPMLFGRVQPE